MQWEKKILQAHGVFYDLALKYLFKLPKFRNCFIKVFFLSSRSAGNFPKYNTWETGLSTIDPEAPVVLVEDSTLLPHAAKVSLLLQFALSRLRRSKIAGAL